MTSSSGVVLKWRLGASELGLVLWVSGQGVEEVKHSQMTVTSGPISSRLVKRIPNRVRGSTLNQ
ncbi:hypothetical protein N7517_005515 [Penicillium concentricum]|uniref:Uncharacterized protein n=1 Tax=Penicillium concentricum TaxID=293559 RepID=A0A9W9VAF2_9EURO|nr:uncharacterized protein N7517_005515 [Penicillium concentricum]KAJ5373509.1 hypothetical protein N7517_005515 [Penicillium concentricum]